MRYKSIWGRQYLVCNVQQSRSDRCSRHSPNWLFQADRLHNACQQHVITPTLTILGKQQKYTLENIQEVRALFIRQMGSMMVCPSCTLEKGQFLLHETTFQVHITGAERSCQRSGFGEQVCPGQPQQCGSSINSLVPTINDYDTWRDGVPFVA